jgi:hypothetical protein
VGFNPIFKNSTKLHIKTKRLGTLRNNNIRVNMKKSQKQKTFMKKLKTELGKKFKKSEKEKLKLKKKNGPKKKAEK